MLCMHTSLFSYVVLNVISTFVWQAYIRRYFGSILLASAALTIMKSCIQIPPIFAVYFIVHSSCTLITRHGTSATKVGMAHAVKKTKFHLQRMDFKCTVEDYLSFRP